MKKLNLLLFSISFLTTTLCLAQNDCVYMAGFARDGSGRQYAAYWRSGQITKLSNGIGDEARTIAVAGSDVHVGGFRMNGVNRVAAYWKNGQQMQLNLIGNYSGKASEVYAIKTVGSDVYMFVTQPNRMSTTDPLYYYYYKNGNPVKILISENEMREEYRGVARGNKSEHFFVTANGDVYEAGVVADYDDSRDRVVYWKNGHRVAERASEKLQKTNAPVQITSIYVTPTGDVYIAGNKPTGKTASETKVQAVYWKNGNEVTVTANLWNTYATGIFVDGSNVYVAGYETRTPSHFSAMYWKNGIKTILHNYDTDQYDATTASIATGFGTVYVAGMHKTSLYWANGKEAKLDQPGQIYSMAIVKGGGCYNNYNNTQSAVATTPTYQSSGYTNQVTQQTSLAQDVTQLAVGVSGLIASFKADKERRIAEEKQAAIAKSNAERQLVIDADNGVYDAQIEVARKYFEEKKYNLAQDYYFEASQNTNVNQDKRNDVLDDLMITLAFQGKKQEIFDLFNYIKSNKIVNYYANETLAFLQLYCDELCPDYLNCNDSIAIVEAIKVIKPYYFSGKMIAPDEPDMLYVYFQITGKYEKYGIPKDEKQGLSILEKALDSKYIFNSQKCAAYYLGLIYLNGTATIQANAKKALKYFKKGYDRPEKVYHLAPRNSFFENKYAYFNYHMLNYIKMAELYSKSEDKDDSELGKKMLSAFYTFYKPMIPNSDMEYFKPYFAK